MGLRAGWIFLGALSGCAPHALGVPAGPPPVYEKPPLPPWDGGAVPPAPSKARGVGDGGVAWTPLEMPGTAPSLGVTVRPDPFSTVGPTRRMG
jgi:hypothetical protein